MDSKHKPAEPSPEVAPMRCKCGCTQDSHALIGRTYVHCMANDCDCINFRPAVAPLETQTGLQGADDVLYRLLQFVWLAGYSDTSPIVAEAEAFVRARLEEEGR